MDLPRTIFNLAFRVYVQKRAFLVMTCMESSIEVAFRHFRHVIFMKKFTLVAFFAKTSQPMLANNCAVTTDVSIRALWPVAAALRLAEEFAYCCRGF